MSHLRRLWLAWARGLGGEIPELPSLITKGDLKSCAQRGQSMTQVQGHFRGIKIKLETAPENCLEISDH